MDIILFTNNNVEINIILSIYDIIYDLQLNVIRYSSLFAEYRLNYECDKNHA